MSVVREIEKSFKKPHVVDVRSGDTVRVYQKIREGGKERVQYFEGLVIRVDRKKSHTASITVRRIASGVGVEKTYLLHSPLVTKVEIKKRSRVRRNYLSYMRERTGKSARLANVDFDREAVNKIPDTSEEPENKLSSEKPTEEPAKEKPEAESKLEEKPSETSKPEPKKEGSKTEEPRASKADK